MKRTLVLGLAILASAAIFSADKLHALSQSENTINLTSGKIRLGEVYRETLTTSYQVKFDGEKKSTTDLKAKTPEIYTTVYSDFVNSIDLVNKQREKSKEEPLSIDSAIWKKDAIITLMTQVMYQSQYQPSFVLTIDETEIKFNALGENTKSINSYISDIKSYAVKMEALYEKDHSFIK